MKKPASLFTSLIILSSSLSLSSCGGGNSKGKASLGMVEEQSILANEKNIAVRICYAYQSKSQKFRSMDFYGGKFVFEAKNTDCQNMVTTSNILTNMKNDTQNALSYIPAYAFDSTLAFNKKVQTDSSGYLAQVCSKILTNQPVNNTISQENIKIQISFFTEDLDGFMLQYFNKQSDNSYVFDSAEKFKIPTSQNAPIRGMDQYYSLTRVCPNSLDKNRNSIYEQNFISR